MARIALAILGLTMLVLLTSRKTDTLASAVWRGCSAYTPKSRYTSTIVRASTFFNVPAPIIEAILYVESSDGVNNQPGTSGEIGVMQILPTTLTKIKQAYPDLKDYSPAIPEEAIFLGAAYLAMLFKVYPRWEIAIGRYNATSPDKQLIYWNRVKSALARVCANY